MTQWLKDTGSRKRLNERVRGLEIVIFMLVAALGISLVLSLIVNSAH